VKARTTLALGLLLALGAATAQAQQASSGEAIRAGRAAMAAGQPARARDLFAQALAQSQGHPADGYAAAIGLGRAALWLGDMGQAERAFRQAGTLAADDGQRRTADAGLAQALNARDFPRQAWALVAPGAAGAAGDARATLELMRAAQALGWQDRALPALAATPAPDDTGYLGTQFHLLADDMRYATAARVETSASYSHDSENLDSWSVGASALSPLHGHASGSQRWGVAAETTRLDDERGTRHLQNLSGLAQLRIGDAKNLDLRLGAGQAAHWHYLQGDARWSWQPDDRYGISIAAARAPLLTTTAVSRHIAYATYSVGATLRPAASLYLLPTLYRQAFTDGNRRDGGSLRLVLSPVDLGTAPVALGAQAALRMFRSSQPGGGAYFNPDHYRAVTAGLTAVARISAGWRLRAVADGGRQRADGSEVGVYSANVTLEGRLPHNGRLQVQALRSSAASLSNGGAGYWDNSLTVSLGFPL
jgi:hypothetical protein